MSKHPSCHEAPVSSVHRTAPAKVSPLILCERLIQVAQDADRAGYQDTAAHLVTLVDRMFEPPPRRN